MSPVPGVDNSCVSWWLLRVEEDVIALMEQTGSIADMDERNKKDGWRRVVDSDEKSKWGRRERGPFCKWRRRSLLVLISGMMLNRFLFRVVVFWAGILGLMFGGAAFILAAVAAQWMGKEDIAWKLIWAWIFPNLGRFSMKLWLVII